MNQPVLSHNFTIEDIHKLREYNYYQTKDMSRQERIDYYNTSGMEVHKEIQARKKLDGSASIHLVTNVRTSLFCSSVRRITRASSCRRFQLLRYGSEGIGCCFITVQL